MRNEIKPLLLIALDKLAGEEKETLKIAKQFSEVEDNFGFSEKKNTF